MLMFLSINKLNAKELTIDYFSMVFSAKFEKTTILDQDVYKVLKVYGDKINENIDINMLRQILEHNDFVIYENETYLYVANKKQQETQQETTYSSMIIDIPFLPQKVDSICSTLNVNCQYLSNSSYIVYYSSKDNISPLLSLKDTNVDLNKQLQLSILEINFNDLEDKNINVSAIFKTLVSNSMFDFSLLSNLNNSSFVSQTNSYVNISTAINFLESKGYVNLLKKQSFPLLNFAKSSSFHLGETTTVLDKNVTNAETGLIEKSYKEINTGLTINFTPLYFKDKIYVDLNINDIGSPSFRSDGTYNLPNSKNVSTSLIFDNKKNIYYIPFSSSQFSNYEEKNLINLLGFPVNKNVSNKNNQIFLVLEIIDDKNIESDYIKLQRLFFGATQPKK